jgi:MOSC domain-containing protein YiiM
MKILSVNIGLPREVVWKHTRVETAIFKGPVDTPVALSRLNFAGDQQADLTVHGGPEKAVYAYPAEHYDYWRGELPGTPLSWAAFGENLTTDGLQEDTLCIGDVLRIGSAVLTVTQPRLPCYKLNIRFGREDMIKRFLLSGRSGFYFSVLSTGEVSAGDEINVVSRDPDHVSVADILHLYFGQTRDPNLFERAISLRSLPESWKPELMLRARSARHTAP